MFFLTQTNDDALLVAQEMQHSRWWVELQGLSDPQDVKLSQSMLSEGLWFGAASSMKNLAIQSRGLHSISQFQQRQVMADKFIYKAQVLLELFDNLRVARVILSNPEISTQMAEMLQTMKDNFPSRA